MFIDNVTIDVQAGKGGNGAVSFRREKFVPRGGPDGGDGGLGGSVKLQAVSDKTTLSSFRYKKVFGASAGANGSGATRHGKNGEDLVLEVPVGTLVYQEDHLLADMAQPGQVFVVAKGGKGGRGNIRFATSVHKAPKNAELGLPGQQRTIRLELKLMADVGLIGYPNVGKSTLLSVISRAKPKIGDFPFTTLTPNLGVVEFSDSSFVVADIPGLIEGAHAGKGLGHRFLQHVERTRLLVHIIDIAGLEGRSPSEDYQQINIELKKFNSRLADLPQLVVLNKVDLLHDRQAIDEFKARVKAVEIMEISAATKEGTDALVKRMSQLLEDLPRQDLFSMGSLPNIELTPQQGIIVEQNQGVYYVSGRRVEVLAAKTDFNNDEAVANFYRMAKMMGIFDLLRKEGIEPGDTVVIADQEFTYE